MANSLCDAAQYLKSEEDEVDRMNVRLQDGLLQSNRDMDAD